MVRHDQPEKLLQAAQAVLSGAPGGEMNVVALNKALFYLDLIALRDSGQTFTGAIYVALENGPVVDKYRDELLPWLEGAGIAKQRNQGWAKPVKLEPGANVPPSDMPTELVEQARKLGADTAPRSSSRLSADSHKNPGWKAAYDPDNQGRPINMLVALQGLPSDDDDWLDEDDPEFNAAMAAPDEISASW